MFSPLEIAGYVALIGGGIARGRAQAAAAAERKAAGVEGGGAAEALLADIHEVDDLELEKPSSTPQLVLDDSRLINFVGRRPRSLK